MYVYDIQIFVASEADQVRDLDYTGVQQVESPHLVNWDFFE
jgi:hypothetical protein